MAKSYTVTVDDDVAEVFERVCAQMQGPGLNAGETMTPDKLLSWLIDDVRYLETRPGCWEAGNMTQVLVSHGFIEG